ncbi:MAG: hypothetical protein COT46_07865 [Sulfurimonas sp. CG08_land_8_20_14_0_20_36_33]|nr:MAG: hypothetical protein AUJ81_04675 [Helicobacteraceae bacterium CG1_02_36_14]PIP09531.1 MAG: hypothetical protein COX50_10480 [Sulfurimonas sp. CG23_combo_of_CG06-09_8_20_14_all_36_33]PIS24876.1 MAG: hypothetical protein COT46_07865 [Sulfurimonas sp. CG08_land_8_20_14_0_20_36_33]PIU33601.1 MAG: hypothetical protein COT05_11310 [Sulfurimonas sp. CG07_land_8_20_14_0_80_36_56]PIV05562.1 MAG: hypothetical protein COS56_00840 [Sulfurimonas sp. CG03_land_8_20_14_0_80_36_25]PIV34791.1 MAG: hypo
MSIMEFWSHSDWVIKVLLLVLGVVLVMVFEKLYHYFLNYKSMQQLQNMNTLNELDTMDESFIKETLLEIKNFSGSSEALFNSFVGVKLDLYEHYMMRYVTIIGVVAILSPMLGLIGTFIGVWHVFEGVGNIGLNDPAVIAKGIKEVIIDTMAGLVVAVIAMIFYKTFEFIGAKSVTKFEEKLYKLLRGQDA